MLIFCYKFCFALNQSFKSLVCEHLFMHVMRFRGRPFNLQGCLCFYPNQKFWKRSYNPTARQSDSPLVQQSDSSTVRQFDRDVFVFQLHLSSKNSNKVKIRGNTSKDLKSIFLNICLNLHDGIFSFTYMKKQKTSLIQC